MSGPDRNSSHIRRWRDKIDESSTYDIAQTGNRTLRRWEERPEIVTPILKIAKGACGGCWLSGGRYAGGYIALCIAHLVATQPDLEARRAIWVNRGLFSMGIATSL
jgi:hypothetical protein